MGKKLYVGNLSYQVSDSDLEGKFSEFGKVESVKIIVDHETGRSKGFAFVEMGSEDEAKTCIDSLDNQDFHGRGMRVSEARERQRR